MNEQSKASRFACTQRPPHSFACKMCHLADSRAVISTNTFWRDYSRIEGVSHLNLSIMILGLSSVLFAILWWQFIFIHDVCYFPLPVFVCFPTYSFHLSLICLSVYISLLKVFKLNTPSLKLGTVLLHNCLFLYIKQKVMYPFVCFLSSCSIDSRNVWFLCKSHLSSSEIRL